MSDNDIYVGNTDENWFRHLKAMPNLSEVNFWQPSPQHFKAIPEGGTFLFRLKSPINKIAGFGTLASASTVTVEQAWRDMGELNGVASLEEFLKRLGRYREGKAQEYSRIGFKIIAQPVFLDEADWIEQPTDWKPQIVTGKSYHSDSLEGQKLMSFVRQHSAETKQFSHDRQYFEGFGEAGQERFGSPKLVSPRLGQASFRLSVFGAYDGACCVTGTTSPPTLEAAHIRPYSEGGSHEVRNGLLLRVDIHRLFDAGLLTLDENLRLRISAPLKDDSTYAALEGHQIESPHYGPDPCEHNVAWHRVNKFRG